MCVFTICALHTKNRQTSTLQAYFSEFLPFNCVNVLTKSNVKLLLKFVAKPFFTNKKTENGKIDAFAFERRQMEYAIKNGQKGVRLLDENLGEDTNIAVGLSPKSSIPDLETKINDFIAKIKADGTFDDMYERWLTDGNETMPDVAPAKEVKYHLVVGTTETGDGSPTETGDGSPTETGDGSLSRPLFKRLLRR